MGQQRIYHAMELLLDRCPHCSIAVPHLQQQWIAHTNSRDGNKPRSWATYTCGTCGGVILTYSYESLENPIQKIWPEPQSVAEEVPERSREYLNQAIASLHAPVGAVMLAASSVDAMLKDKGYKDGSLFVRIDKAASDHLITSEMAAWAHEVRLDANDQRHSDENAQLPSPSDAERSVEFVQALAQFLYVLPARVKRGRGASVGNF